MVKIGGPKTTFVSQVRIRSELSDNHSGMTYLTFSECVHDAIPSGDLALHLQVSSSNSENESSDPGRIQDFEFNHLGHLRKSGREAAEIFVQPLGVSKKIWPRSGQKNCITTWGIFKNLAAKRPKILYNHLGYLKKSGHEAAENFIDRKIP